MDYLLVSDNPLAWAFTTPEVATRFLTINGKLTEKTLRWKHKSSDSYVKWHNRA